MDSLPDTYILHRATGAAYFLDGDELAYAPLHSSDGSPAWAAQALVSAPASWALYDCLIRSLRDLRAASLHSS